MLRTIPITMLCSLVLLSQAPAQDVFVPRQLRKLPTIKPDEGPTTPAPAVQLAPAVAGETTKPELPSLVVTNASPTTANADKPARSSKVDSSSGPTKKVTAQNARSEKVDSAKSEPSKQVTAKGTASSLQLQDRVSAMVEAKKSSPKDEVANGKVRSVRVGAMPGAETKGPGPSLSTEKTQSTTLELKPPRLQAPPVHISMSNSLIETAATRLADGFDFPVGKPDAEGYYKARGYRSGGHMGEDWDGVGGGDTDLGDPIYCIGDGVVVFARDVHLGWGNVVIVRHAFREDGAIRHIDSLYGHLQKIVVKRGQRVSRGQEIGTMGTAHGQYDAHLHLEIRKNLEIGMSKSKFQKNLSNYYDPSDFIVSHRRLSGGGASFRVAMNTFIHDGAFHFDRAPNHSPRRRSTSESAAALKRALSGATTADRD